MADVDFSDLDSATAWFETQSVEMRCAVMGRRALRVSGNIYGEDGNNRNLLAIAAFRATLISLTRGICPVTTKGVNWHVIALNAASFAHDEVEAAARTSFMTSPYDPDGKFSVLDRPYALAHGAAKSAQLSALVASQMKVSGHDLDGLHERALSAMQWDAAQRRAALATTPLWAGAEVPEGIARNHEAFLTFLRSDPAWAFWLRFYEGMWNGTFDEWPLALDVIGIEEEDWEKGHEHVGDVIAQLKADRKAGSSNIVPEAVEPNNVISLFDRVPIVGASMGSLTEAVELRIDLFSRLILLNEQIAFFETLKSLPVTANRIVGILEQGAALLHKSQREGIHGVNPAW